jgi:hypothetical protein
MHRAVENSCGALQIEQIHLLKKISMPATAHKKKHSNKKKPTAKATLSHTRKPAHLTVAEWQTLLRKQIAEKSAFTITNVGEGLVYSDYKVYNNGSKNTYKVALRSKDNSLNFCSCYDFKTNQLGTCKHVEAVMAKIAAKPALRRALDAPYTPAYSSVYICYVGTRNVMVRIGTEDKAAYTRLFKKYIDKNGSLLPIAFEHIDVLLKKAYAINSGFRIYEDALAFILAHRSASNRQAFLQPFIKKGSLPPVKNLRLKPFPYQAEGIMFAAKAGRSILADDMGLGKTIQAIGTAELMAQYFDVQKVLIICPTSLKYQWLSEINKFTQSKATVIEGNYIKRMSEYGSHEDCLYKIVTYNMAVRDIKAINDWQPDLIILDEAQRIKNWQAKISQQIKKLHSTHALVLTGTPIENKLEELYSLMQFINPLLLGSLYHFTSQHQQTDEIGKIVGYKDLHLIKQKMTGYLQRRTRKQVLQQLPARTDTNLFVEITPEQRDMHEEYVAHVSKLVKRWRNMGFLSEEDRLRLMNLLSLMRMVCNSTYIIDQETNYQVKLDELKNIVEQVVESGTEKIVIFSQWERFTRLIAQMLQSMDIGYVNLNGNVPGNKRKQLIDDFNNLPHCRVFLSTDAGGTGLNLQSASILINMDLPWNPAVLEQRIARVYRYGQKSNVSVINFVAEHTIEHGMLARLSFKKALADGILDNGEPNVFMGESKLNSFMKGVEELVNNDAVKHSAPPITDDENLEVRAAENSKETHAEEPAEEMMPATPQTLPAAVAPADMLATFSTFVNQLSQVLSQPAGAKQLVEQLTRKDEQTGQVYLQVPVASTTVVEQAVNLLSVLFKAK